MITKKEEIANSFYAFHDGHITLEKVESSNVIWKIDCKYLAERINPKFDCFWIEIFNCQSIQFLPWVDPAEIWTDIQKIFQTELEISSAKVINERIEICCHQHNNKFDFQGGEIRLDCEGIIVHGQEWNEIHYEKLHRICKDYWDQFR